MLESVKGACTKYQIFLDQQSVDREKNKVDYQLKIIAFVEAEFIVKTCTKKKVRQRVHEWRERYRKRNICTATR